MIDEVFNKSHKQEDKQLSYFTKNGYSLKFRLNLDISPIGKPLLVVLHGHAAHATAFQYPGWNVLAPLDDFGYENKGCWWLGENGNFFLKDLLQELILSIVEKYECRDKIYFYGSSMGGYGALLHGILCEAKAVYANVPQIVLKGSNYFNHYLVENINNVITNPLCKENNLINYLDDKKRFPTFFLCENMLEGGILAYNNYLQEHTLQFANKCIEKGIKVHLELLPQSGHTKNYGLKEVITKLERFSPVDYCIQKNITLIKENWFYNIAKHLDQDFIIENNVLSIENILFLSQKPFYIISGNNKLKEIGDRKEKYNVQSYKLFNISCIVKNISNCKVEIFVLQFNDKEKVKGKKFLLKEGKNSIKISKEPATKYIKLAFRIDVINQNKRVFFRINDLYLTSGGNIEKKNNLIQASATPSFDFLQKNISPDKIDPVYDKYVQYDYNEEEFQINILTHFKKNNRLVVFYNGAVDVEKTPPPAFQRWSWLKDIPYSSMIIMDPTIYKLKEMYEHDSNFIGWYQGDKDTFILKKINKIVIDIAEKLGISHENILFYGSSAGGFASLISATLLPGSKACVVNPQTDILQYAKKYVHKLLSYMDISEERAREKETFNVMKFMSKQCFLPQVYYKQNKVDEEHYLKHFKLLKQFYDKNQKLVQYHEVLFEDERGHSAIPKLEEALNDIEETFNIFEKMHIDIKYYGFNKNNTEKNYFQPRKDTPSVYLKVPIDWTQDPLNDRNWCFHLHAWRMLDNVFLEYENTKNKAIILKAFEIVKDWYSATIENENITEYSWYDMAVGLRATKLAFFYEKCFLIQSVKLDDEDEIILDKLVQLHLEHLQTQHISDSNHGIFQLHGLVMLAWIKQDNIALSYALKKMETLLQRQFFSDGFHTENSDEYHWFVFDRISELLSFEAYRDSKILQKLIAEAEKVKKWTVFPDKSALCIGDSSFTKRRVDFFDDDVVEDMVCKYFKESGYLFIRSHFNTPASEASMLFMQTVFKNKTHRHADDFNILLYEYGKNILVDAGKHSYEYKSDERQYVSSTKAHNCLVVDNTSYEIKNGQFYESALIFCEEKNGVFLGKTSLKRKEFDIEHHRVFLYKPKAFLIVMDSVVSDKKHLYDQYWHFHQDLVLDELKHGYRTDINQDIQMYVESYAVNVDKKKKQSHTMLYKGQIEPELQGWRSLKYRELTPNYALQNSIKAKKAVLVTKFIFDISLDVGINFLKTKQGISCQMSAFDIELVL